MGRAEVHETYIIEYFRKFVSVLCLCYHLEWNSNSFVSPFEVHLISSNFFLFVLTSNLSPEERDLKTRSGRHLWGRGFKKVQQH